MSLFCRSLIAGGIALAALPGVAPLAQAQPAAPPTDPNGTFSFLWENDAFAATDRYYTNGVQLSWLSPSSPPPWFDGATDTTRFFLGPQSQVRWGLALGQTLFTPEDTERRVPDPNDRPYAAYLFGAVSLVAYSDETLNTVQFQIGVVGPSALGEEVQNNFHDLIGDGHAEGWDYQLEDEVGVNLIFDRKWRAISLTGPRTGLGIDLTPSATLSLGNVATYAAGGLMFRLGQNLDSDFGAPRIRPALTGSNFYDKRDGFGWYLFAGVEGRAIARDIFLDGNTFDGDSPHVDKRNLVGDAQAGFSLFFGSTRLTYTYVVRSEEFEGQDGLSRFGSASIGWSF